MHVMQANPADVYMDIIAGLVQPCPGSGLACSTPRHGASTLAADWRLHALSISEMQPSPEVELKLAAASAADGFGGRVEFNSLSICLIGLKMT